MRVLVTGSSGFIGTPVVDRLRARGDEVVAYDAVGGHDVLDAEALAAASRGADAVVHLAGKVGLERSVDDLDDYVAANSLGTARVLRTAAQAGIRRLVLASSMVVYGEGRYHCPEHGVVSPGVRRVEDLQAGRFEPPCPVCGRPLEPGSVPESAPLAPRSAYAATKVHLEHLAAVWAGHTGGVAVALRYHNVYGPGMPRDTPYAGVTSLFRAALSRGEAPRVFEDGAQRRNFVHVHDVADATVAALTASLGPGVTPVNIGSDTVTTVGAMATALADSLGGPTPVVTGEYRVGDVRHVTADCSAASGLLGWTPRIPLAAGLTDL